MRCTPDCSLCLCQKPSAPRHPKILIRFQDGGCLLSTENHEVSSAQSAFSSTPRHLSPPIPFECREIISPMVQKCQILTQNRKVFLIFFVFFRVFLTPFPIFLHSPYFVPYKKYPSPGWRKGIFLQATIPFADRCFPSADHTLKL